MMALRRVPWLMMSGASIAAGKSLSRAGSMVIAVGAVCARVVVEERASRSDAVAMSLAIRESFVGFMARHFGGFCELAHRKNSERSERAPGLNFSGISLLPCGSCAYFVEVDS
jgi:chloramphenicol 3-O-phosphotransferase